MDILEILNEDGFVYQKKASTGGGEYKGPCPFCGGRDRFGVYPMTDHWVCRSCKKAGDSIEYLKLARGLNYYEACAALGREPEMDTWKLPKIPLTWQPRIAPPPPAAWQERARELIETFHEELMSPRRELKRKYLNRRGIKDETIIKFKLGWNNEALFQKREDWGLEKKTNEKTGRESKIWIPSGISIPYIIEQKPVRIRIRQASPHDPKDKYIIVSGSNTAYMQFAAFNHNKPIQIVEAELDGILIDQEAGNIVNAMAVGNSSARPDTSADKNIKDCQKIILSLDNDEAGREEIKWWKAQYPIVETLLTPGCKDVGDYFKAGENVREWVEQGIREIAAEENEPQNEIDIDAPPAITLDMAYNPATTTESEPKPAIEALVVAQHGFDPSKYNQDCHGVMCVHTAWKKVERWGHMFNWNICRKHTEAVDVWAMKACPLGKWKAWEHKFLNGRIGD